jgi:hypothetical protein
MPFYAAEQCRKGRNSAGTCLSHFKWRVLQRPAFPSSTGKSRIYAGPSERLHFLLVRFLYASKENEQIKRSKET